VADESSVSPSEEKEFNLYNERIDNLQQFSGRILTVQRNKGYALHILRLHNIYGPSDVVFFKKINREISPAPLKMKPSCVTEFSKTITTIKRVLLLLGLQAPGFYFITDEMQRKITSK
jgi:hypothetical protein